MNQQVINEDGVNSSIRHCEERTFCSHDGAELFYRFWPSTSTTNLKGNKKAVVMFHRGHEHGGRMAHLVNELAMDDTAFFAWDARGLGNSPGERGHAESFAELVQDVNCFIEHIYSNHGFKSDDIIVLGQSVGAVLVSTWVHDYAPKVRAMVLAAPAFRIKLYLPGARAMIAARQKISGVFTVNSYVKAHYLSHDPERIQTYNQDPLITRPIASNLLLDLEVAAKRCVEDAHAITVPTLTLVSGDDWVVEKGPQYEFMARLGSERKRIVELPGFFHDTLGEQEREHALVEVRRFLSDSYKQPVSRVDLTAEDKHGASYQKQMGFSAPATGYKHYYWSLLRRMINTATKVSEGYHIGKKTGFDSGSTLDYVYQNLPQGKGWIGTQIDRAYLNNIGWKGIRQRKVNLQALINTAIDKLKQQEQPVRILDVAAGHGRYVLDAIDPRRDDVDSVQLRDFSDINVIAGAQAISERGFDSIGNFVQGDAFDKESLATITPAATLAIVSGLYELFSENNLIQDSLQGLADAVKPGGYLIYTNQPWHPQQELIARCLSSHRDGQPWVMRCRSQAEMDQLVEQAGFRKLDQLIDKWGIFSVSIAQRIEQNQ